MDHGQEVKTSYIYTKQKTASEHYRKGNRNIIRKGKTTNKANIPKQFPRHVWYTRGVKQNKLMHEISIL